MTNDWDPALYARFEAERTRPARDLLANVALGQPACIVDLGCGPGNSTGLLQGRYPATEILGIDSSAAMIDEARRRLPDCRFEQADIATFAPREAPDLLFANASLQWVGDHETLLPRLVQALRPGGMLAFQVPDNRDEPTHRLMREIAAEAAFKDAIPPGSAERLNRLPAEAYYDLLAPLCERVDVWRTVYHHRMPDAAAVVEWFRATGLRPFLEPLDAGQRAAFEDAYRARIDQAYPSRADGSRLLAFPRLFVVAELRG